MIAQSMLLKFQAVNTEIVVKGPRKIIHLLPEKKGRRSRVKTKGGGGKKSKGNSL